MNKKLFIVATPIGNIKEISELAITTLTNNSIFFCEDTRNSKKLLNLLNISLENKTFYSLNGNNEKQFINSFDFKDNEYCLLSDAGYPILSDPGFLLINYFIKNNWDVQIINGPSSLMHSLIVSGFPSSNVLFYGFLNHSKNLKQDQLNQLKNETKTIIIFESVHRIKETLKMIKDVFDNSKNICIARELTKMNETIYRCSIEKADKIEITEKGEFVILIDNNIKDTESVKKEETDYSIYLNELEKLIRKGEKEKVACKMVSYKYSLKSNSLYNFWQQRKNCF